MLTIDSVASVLVDRDLIPVSWIIDGSLTITSAARRNRNFKVTGPGGAGLFLKQADNMAGGSRETLRQEARFHRLCREEPALASIAEVVPRLVAFDDSDGLLVFELIADVTSFRDLWESPERLEPALNASRTMGMVLGRLHRLSGSVLRQSDAPLAWLSREMPWSINAHQPGPSLLAELNPAAFEVIRILQTDENFVERLDPICELWCTKAVIHGDVRFDNVLIRMTRAGDSDDVGLWIADWELVQLGDPAWDLAGAFQDCLVYWVSTMPRSGNLSAEERIAGARWPLASLRRATRALWSGYREGAGSEPAEADDLLSRAVRFSAVRLVQSAFEAAITADHLPGQSVILLQLSSNMLAEPERAQVQLYGIPVSDPRT